jgi:hypothetical protein
MGNTNPLRTGCLTLRIGDVTFALTSDDPGLMLEAQGPVRHFVAADSEPDVRLSVARGASCEAPSGETLFDAGTVWQLYRHGRGYLFRFRAPGLGPEPYKTASFDPEFTTGDICLRQACFPGGQPVYPLEYPLDELLMVNLLARGRGVELHGCGIADSDGRGYLFLGQSGAGKSTTARLWTRRAGPHVLSDDRIILRMLNGRVWMYGTPWHGEAEMASAQRTPVDRIFFLARGAKNELRPLAEADAVMRLIACSFVPFHRRSALDFTLSFLQQVTSSVPCAEFRFVPDERAVDAIRERAA